MTSGSLGVVVASVAFTNLKLLLPFWRKFPAKPQFVCWNRRFLDIFLFDSEIQTPSLLL